ncbi:MAG TPA: FAD-dependent oxidoreductase [Steroidobacteraceae bacterium]|nr:FAD-dependent oxidoreductase [Steroidobacteraceae bacterium]
MNSPLEGPHRWLAALGRPLRLAGITLPNRLMMSALTLQYGVDGLISDRHVAFYRERARGGAGLLFSEQLDASPLSASPFTHALSAYDTRQIGRFAHLSAALRPFDTRFFAQLFSAGAAGNSTVGMSRWSALRGPAGVPAPGGEPPSPLSEEEIAQLVRDYADSARNVREGGLHGIEVHGAHGWLVGQFLSPLYNRRQDRYGGTVENRCRLALEIGRAIRARVGADFPVGLSLTYDELMGPAGITEEDTLAQLRWLDQHRVFDYFDLSIGSSHQQHYTIASMAVPEGFSLAFAARAKAVVHPQTAIFTSGRVVDVLQAGRAIEEGHADVVGMARALLADPHLLAKARAAAAGHSDHRTSRITRCVGANYCVARALVDQPVACVLNPATGRESQWPQISAAPTRLSITVIGAGPAGLRLAGIAASAGHEVTVLEQRAHPGGHVALLARLPTREPWNRAIEDLVGTLELHRGRLLLGVTATVDSVLQTAPDVVVVATGASWILPSYELAHSIRFLTLDAAIEDSSNGATTGEHVLIADATGTYAPLGLADALCARGSRVTLVTRNESLGHISWLELDLQHVMPRLTRRGVRSIVAHQITHAERDCVILESIWGGLRQELAPVDAVVFAETRRANSELFRQLGGRHSRVYCIGDARSPRSTAAVIHEAETLARSL